MARSADAQPLERERAPRPSEAVPAAPAGPEYRARIELGDGVVPGLALFVSLRAAPGGPPAAVKRIMRPQFPLEVVLGTSESMMGQPLPEAGTLTARLDADGSASTRAETDIEAMVEAKAGESVVLVLEADG